jgi:uncharacterized protein YutE (UPF0331/DUF86 family)
MLSSRFMAKSRDRNIDKPTLRGSARKTLNAARYFFDQAGRHATRIEHEYYVDAAVVFARAVLEHLQKDFGGKGATKKKAAAEQLIKNLAEQLQELIKLRNEIIHEHPIGIVPAQNEGLYSEAYEMLREQLDQIESIVEMCEKQFK